MVAYFPQILPDELLYSAVARFGSHRGLPSDAALAREIFGRRHAVASVDLPGDLAALASRTGMKVDALIDDATLLPFYAAFSSADVRTNVRTAMAASVSGAHTRLGVTTFRIPALRTLRYCPECLTLMKRSFGEPYWRRTHQLPGVVVCPDHGALLIDAGVDLGGRHRHRFVAANAIGLTAAASAAEWLDPRVAARLRELAIAASALLTTPMPALEPAEHAAVYRERLAAVGLSISTSSSAKIDQRGLEAAFLGHWGGALAMTEGVLVDGRPAGGWLAAMTHHRSRSAHPVCHLLLRLFLDAQALAAAPFGRGPWPCRNPVNVHHGQEVVTSLTVRRDRAVRYGDFRCGCGYVYTRSVDAAGMVGEPRFRSFGPDLAPALRLAIREGRGLRAASRSFGIDPKTLMREAAIAGVDVPWRLRPSGAARIVGQTAPRPSVSSDRQKSVGIGVPSRDWSLVDRRLAKSTDAHGVSILRETPPVRVTAAELERRVAKHGWVAKRRGKLPRTSERMVALVEGLDAFRRRRLEWVLSTTSDDPTRTASDVLRRAGLPMSWMTEVRDALGEPHGVVLQQALA